MVLQRNCEIGWGDGLMEIIKVENITKRFENETILHGVSLALRQGEKVTILGGSGSGKTTFFESVSGIIAV